MIYDVSWPITPEMTRWPRTPAPRREMLYSISQVSLSAGRSRHTPGTHIDAPEPLPSGRRDGRPALALNLF